MIINLYFFVSKQVKFLKKLIEFLLIIQKQIICWTYLIILFSNKQKNTKYINRIRKQKKQKNF